MGTEVWPGESMSSDISKARRVLLRADDTDSSDSLSDSSSDLSSDEEDVPETKTPRDSDKPRKRVTFQTDENLVEIFEIPARGQEFFEEICEVIEQVVVSRDSLVHQEPESDLHISGHAAGLSSGQTSENLTRENKLDKLQRPERPDRNVLHRKNTDVWGTYTVTHVNTPSTNSTGTMGKTSKPPSPVCKPRIAPQTRTTVSSESRMPPPIPPKPPVPVQRRYVRAKTTCKGKKKATKVTKDSKSNGNSNAQDENDGEKLIAMFLEKNANKEDLCDAENSTQKNSKPKASRRGGHRRTISSARNREKEIINKEMKGEVQRRVFKTYNNISSLHRPGQRTVNKWQNQSDSSDKRNTSDKTRVKSANRNCVSVDGSRLNTGSKTKLGRTRQSSAESTGSVTAKEQNGASRKNDMQQENIEKLNIIDVSEEAEKNTPKTNGFIFPEEKTFHFPLMSPPKETTSQLVRLDSNMLSLYKKKLYAWHMANGTVAEGRIETPCISPMWEPVKPSYS